MNKIKLMYDVVKAMKEKEVFQGTLKAEGMKGQAKILDFENVFEKNCLTGRMKARLHTEIDCEGKKMKMENSIDMEMPEGHRSCCCLKHMHNHHYGTRCGGFKEGLNKIVAVLAIFNSIKAEVQEDKSVILSLEMGDMPEETRKCIIERMCQGCEKHSQPQGSYEYHRFLKEFHSIQKPDFKLRIAVNGNNEIEKVSLEVKGELENEATGKQDMLLTAELCLNW